MGREARVFRSDRSQRRLPIPEAPHETGVAGFVDVSNDTDRRDSVQNLELVHTCPRQARPSSFEFQQAGSGL